MLHAHRHDPHAGRGEEGTTSTHDTEQQEKAQQVLQAARQQNLTDGAQRDDFAQKLYLGLKGTKKKKTTAAPQQQPLDDGNEEPWSTQW